MDRSLSLLKRELEGIGCKTLVVSPTAEASTKSDALRAVRSLQKILSSGSKIKGISYAALYGLYELAKIRSKGKKLSDGQKAAVALTLTQLKKTGIFNKLKGFFSFGKKTTIDEDMKELQTWMSSDDDKGFEAGESGTGDAGEEHEDVPPAGDSNSEDSEETEELPPPSLPRKKAAAPKKTAPKAKFDPATIRTKSGKTPRRPSGKVATAAVLDPNLAAALTKRIEALLKNKAVRGALLTSAYGILGIIKKSIKNRRVDKYDHLAVADSIKFILKSPKVPANVREHFESILADYDGAFGGAAKRED